MHDRNAVQDGFFEIIQDVKTKRIDLLKYGQKIKEIQPGRILSIDELHEMLIRERTEMFMEGV